MTNLESLHVWLLYSYYRISRGCIKLGRISAGSARHTIEWKNVVARDMHAWRGEMP